ncbi:hypothetical protein [Cohnella boryungensis]|uniref:Exosporium protein C n=1 Tax=Cohnella boryungensis TaxID=768479 RepID=A0ABV8S5C1_9BACL
MTRLLDARTSQNASFVNSAVVPLRSGESALMGIVGLRVINPTGIIRVDLYAIATFFSEPGGIITYFITIHRGPTEADPLVYSGAQFQYISSRSSVQSVFAIASDFDVSAPASGQLTYSVYLQSTVDSIRSGPESFNAVAYCDT